ncbi:hypothetical protein ANCCAN_08869 [Ancylostoma caninum]|uniref:Uncharacterized protein n=1 Tax=Ancylostoma caninum TaxID=29170 RepID=A0A368GQ17_ANCCA|nr:hypothetical protein ANCCAN_08869 [Ancylostoma caninum]
MVGRCDPAVDVFTSWRTRSQRWILVQTSCAIDGAGCATITYRPTASTLFLWCRRKLEVSNPSISV